MVSNKKLNANGTRHAPFSVDPLEHSYIVDRKAVGELQLREGLQGGDGSSGRNITVGDGQMRLKRTGVLFDAAGKSPGHKGENLVAKPLPLFIGKDFCEYGPVAEGIEALHAGVKRDSANAV